MYPDLNIIRPQLCHSKQNQNVKYTVILNFLPRCKSLFQSSVIYKFFFNFLKTQKISLLHVSWSSILLSNRIQQICYNYHFGPSYLVVLHIYTSIPIQGADLVALCRRPLHLYERPIVLSSIQRYTTTGKKKDK